MVTLAIWGEVTPWAILTKCGLLGDMVDVITYTVFGDCRLRSVGVVRGVSLPSSIDLTRRPYNTGHTTCDRVIYLYLFSLISLQFRPVNRFLRMIAQKT